MRGVDPKTFDVLVVDDEQDNLDAFRFAFRRTYKLHYARGGQEALELLESLDPAVIISDQRMPEMSGIELLRAAKERRPDARGILLTAYADLSVLIDAVNSGAVDRYVPKPWNSRELSIVLRQSIDVFATERDNRRLREQLARYAGYLEREQRDPIDFGELAVDSPAMVAIGERIAEVAPTTSPVLIEAEPGSEKEVVARALHVGSPREGRPFVKVSCAAFRGDALEREIFGGGRHRTDVAEPGASKIELANGGTLYLDDPTLLSPSLQTRLLSLLERGEVDRPGGAAPLAVDVRLIVAVPPRFREMARGEVLPDLLSRLGVFPIRLPPLRERLGDVRPLAEHFLRKYGQRNAGATTSLSGEAVAKLVDYAWPGNLRELESVVERAAIVSRGKPILPEHLAFEASTPRQTAEEPIDLDAQLDDIERQRLLDAIARCGGNKALAARSLGVQRTTLYYRLKRLGIHDGE